MTMVPTTRNLLHHDGVKSIRGRSCYHHGQYYVGIAAQLEDQGSKPSTRSPRPLATMVDDDEAAAAGTRTRSSAAGTRTRSSSSPGAAAAAGNDDEGDCWLQLGLAAASSSASSSSSGDNNITAPDPGPAPPPPTEEGLYLLAYDNKRNASARPPPLFPLPLRSYHVDDQSYGGGRGRYRPAAEASGSAMSAPLAPPPPFIRCSGGAAIRVVSPPRRTEAPGGLWLTLRAAPNQIREPVLPQITKSYLRIKDSNVTVEAVMKYLADKLGIAPSHQVELTCRGQVLRPLLPLKYVRETIWCSTAPPREGEETPPPADLLTSRRSPAATDHVMTLCYSTSRNSKLAPLNL